MALRTKVDQLWPGTSYYKKILERVFQKGTTINPAHVIPSMHLILKAVEEGAGMSLLPTHILKDQNGTNPRWKIIFEDLKVHNEIFIGFKSKHKHVLVINEFIQRVSEDIRDEPGDVHLASNSH